MSDPTGSAVSVEVLALTAALIEVPSPNPPSEERAVAERLAGWLRERGVEAEVIGVDTPDAPQANVFARVRGEGSRPPFILSGHLDTVPPGEGAWQREPYRPTREGGRLYGLGAADMKGAVAAMAVAAAQLAREGALAGDLLLAFTSGEETRSRGARAFARSGLLDGASGLVIGEPTGNRVGVAEKGGIWLDVTLIGQTAHGSLPHLGANAVAALAETLVRLEQAARPGPATPSVRPELVEGPAGASTSSARTAPSLAESRLRDALVRPSHPLLESPTLTATQARGGVASNVVPDRAAAVLDVRTLPGQSGEAILTAVRAVAEEVAQRRGCRATVESRGERVALETPADHPLVHACAAAVQAVTGRAPERCGLTGATDATEFIPALRLPFVICGPGQMAQAHQPDEWVDETAVAQSAEIYARLARHMLTA